jgi:2-acylglycerol O-acyltransferase 2
MAAVQTISSVPETLGKAIPSSVRRPSSRTSGRSSSSNSSTTTYSGPTSYPIAPLNRSTFEAKMTTDDPSLFSSLRRRNPQPDPDGEDDTDGDTQSTASQGNEMPQLRPGKRSLGSESGSGLAGMRERLKSPLMSGLKLDDLRENISKGVEVKWVASTTGAVEEADEDRFAPLHIPPHRRLQTTAVALWALLPIISLFFFFLAM